MKLSHARTHLQLMTEGAAEVRAYGGHEPTADSRGEMAPGGASGANYQTTAGGRTARENRRTQTHTFPDRTAWRKRTVRFISPEIPSAASPCSAKAWRYQAMSITSSAPSAYIAQHGGDSRAFFDVDSLRGACHACHAQNCASRTAAAGWSFLPAGRPESPRHRRGGPARPVS
jgi:hypothetical protein